MSTDWKATVKADQTLKAKQVWERLAISRATFYRNRWFRQRKVRTSQGTVGYLESDVALYQALQRGAA